MESVTLREIAGYCGAAAPVGCMDMLVTAVCTDTRMIKQGSLFVPLKGEKFDGHDFISEAFSKGAAAALSDREIETCKPVIRTPDTLRALHDIASGYRRRFNIMTVGVTGSAGKTTTREMIAAVLGAKYKTLATKGNFNNEVGLPLTVLELDGTHEAAVFEMGMNHFGEISRLSKIAGPDTAVITNIGVMHIEHLGSREGILKAKLEILDGLGRGGMLILNGDDPLLWGLKGKLDYDVMYCGVQNRSCDIFACDLRECEGVTSFRIRTPFGTDCFEIPVRGWHNVSNAACAIACALRYGVDARSAAAGLKTLENFALRQNIYEKSGIVIIDDTYNAGPDSMEAALSVLASIKVPGRRIAVLGGMLELGGYSREAHYRVGESAAENADLLFLYGGDVKYSAEGAVGAGMPEHTVCVFDTHEDMAAVLIREMKKGDAILFKGSRGMKMEEVIKMSGLGPVRK